MNYAAWINIILGCLVLSDHHSRGKADRWKTMMFNLLVIHDSSALSESTSTLAILVFIPTQIRLSTPPPLIPRGNDVIYCYCISYCHCSSLLLVHCLFVPITISINIDKKDLESVWSLVVDFNISGLGKNATTCLKKIFSQWRKFSKVKR